MSTTLSTGPWRTLARASLIGLHLVLGLVTLSGCQSGPKVGERLERRGDEIVIAGQYFHTGAPVVLWTDPGGYDAYRVERRFVNFADSSWEVTQKTGAVATPNRYGLRRAREGAIPDGQLTSGQIERFRGGGWDLPSLQDSVDQFVMHYDVAGTARTCFRILHDMRGLSVHFLLDIDGTIYQTMDVKERGWHATIANDRSVGIEIANIGAYPVDANGRPVKGTDPLDTWYSADDEGRTRINLPVALGDGGVKTPGFIGRPARPEPVVGMIQGEMRRMYDLTPEQYESLARLTAALHAALPKIKLDYPREPDGTPINRALSREDFIKLQGLIGHYHIQDDKQDPGPAFQWDWVVRRAREVLGEPTNKFDPTPWVRHAPPPPPRADEKF
ncbi:MAG: N-acetylmuramoyl-L-alanine amidase [Planctomycetota bacterium]|nr:N-acetylmuramoyl-L-alanine amidase [Planctomycetota bacterium]